MDPYKSSIYKPFTAHRLDVVTTVLRSGDTHSIELMLEDIAEWDTDDTPLPAVVKAHLTYDYLSTLIDMRAQPWETLTGLCDVLGWTPARRLLLASTSVSGRDWRGYDVDAEPVDLFDLHTMEHLCGCADGLSLEGDEIISDYIYKYGLVYVEQMDHADAGAKYTDLPFG